MEVYYLQSTVVGWVLGTDGKVRQEVPEEIYWQNLTSL